MGFSKNQFCKHVEWEDKSSDSIGLRFISNGDKEISKNSKVFVEDNQLALFYLEGQITDVFWPGTHKLSDSDKVAVTSEMLGWRHPFDTPYEGDVYFFNTDSFSKQKWVTHSAVTVNDNENGETKIKCFGTFSYNVINPGNLIAKAFGAKPLLKTSDLEASLNDIITKNIPAIFSESKISVKAAISDSSALSESALSVLQNDFSELGLEVRAFVFDNISNEDEKPTLAAYEETPVEVKTTKTDSIQNTNQQIQYPNQQIQYPNQQIQYPNQQPHSNQQIQYPNQQAQASRSESVQSQQQRPSNPSSYNNYQNSYLTRSPMGGASGGGLAINDAFLRAKGVQQTNKLEERKECPKCHTMVKVSSRFCPNCGSEVNAKKTCSNCGAEINSNAKFCPECGKTVTDIMEAKKNCPNCGAELKPGAKFCPECGTSVLNNTVSANIPANQNSAINQNDSVNQNSSFDANQSAYENRVTVENPNISQLRKDESEVNNTVSSEIPSENDNNISSSMDSSSEEKKSDILESENVQVQNIKDNSERENENGLSVSSSSEESLQTERSILDDGENYTQPVENRSVSEAVNSDEKDETADLNGEVNNENVENSNSQNTDREDNDVAAESDSEEKVNMDLSSENEEVSQSPINNVSEEITESYGSDLKNADTNEIEEKSSDTSLSQGSINKNNEERFLNQNEQIAENQTTENNSVSDSGYENQSVDETNNSNTNIENISQQKNSFQHDIEMMKKIIVESDGVAKENSLQSSAFKSDIQNIYQNEQPKMPSSDNAVPFTGGGTNQNPNNNIQARLQQNINASQNNFQGQTAENSEDDKKK